MTELANLVGAADDEGGGGRGGGGGGPRLHPLYTNQYMRNYRQYNRYCPVLSACYFCAFLR